MFFLVLFNVLLSAYCATINLDWGLSVGNQGTTTISIGDTVKWVWIDSAPHSVQSSSNTFSSNLQSGVGKYYSYKFNTAGSYSYYCGYHGFAMQGVIVVVGDPSPNPTSLPSRFPTPYPTTRTPTNAPTTFPPTFIPTTLPPTLKPSTLPTVNPTAFPSREPTAFPSRNPTSLPTLKPVVGTMYPSTTPTTTTPTASPTAIPTTRDPTVSPTTRRPTTAPPTNSPTTRQPTETPTSAPTVNAPTPCKCASKYQKTVSSYSTCDYKY